MLERPCPDCAFDPAAIEESDYASAIRQATLPWQYVLTRSDVRQRPQPQVWSPLEYAAHVRDVCTVFDARTRLMLDEEDPGFANWDQDEAALAGRYWEADPAVVREELAGAAGRLVTTYEQIPGMPGSARGGAAMARTSRCALWGATFCTTSSITSGTSAPDHAAARSSLREPVCRPLTFGSASCWRASSCARSPGRACSSPSAGRSRRARSGTGAKPRQCLPPWRPPGAARDWFARSRRRLARMSTTGGILMILLGLSLLLTGRPPTPVARTL